MERYCVNAHVTHWHSYYKSTWWEIIPDRNIGICEVFLCLIKHNSSVWFHLCNLSVQLLAPHIRVWDSVSLNTLHVIGMGVFDRAVTCVAFSKSVSRSTSGRDSDQLINICSSLTLFSRQNGGTFLCAVDDANDHILSVWNWQKEKQLADVKVLCGLSPFGAAAP